ncbi:Arylsulfatase precursor [Pelomyxa schiedti]|nr:Arylsulfatase precursor [Pelomyxa schiedti]
MRGLFLLVVVACFVSTLIRSSVSLPNFVVFFADDLGSDLGDVSPTVFTPNIDRMRSEGMKLSQWYAPAVVCTPARATLLTGRYALRSGMTDNLMRVLECDAAGGLPENETTFATHLKTKGYATAAIGKWHLGQREEYLPTNRGFDYYYGIPYSIDMGLFLEGPCQQLGKCVWLPLLEGTKVVKQPVSPYELAPLLRQKAIDWITAHKDSPFLLYYPSPHTHVTDICLSNGTTIRQYSSSMFTGTSKRGTYGDAVQELDWELGGILDTLRSLGLEENTLVFFVSDQGPWVKLGTESGNVGIFSGRYASYMDVGKGSTWEGGLRVSSYAWWPSHIAAGSTSQEVLSHMDIFSTILSLAGISPPDNVTIDGHDITGVLTPSPDIPYTPLDYLFLYRDEDLYAVRNGAYKVHYTTHSGYGHEPAIQHDPPLVFNVEVDPSEAYPLDTNDTTIQQVIVNCQAAVDQHKATMVPGHNQLKIAAPQFTICCDESTDCICGQ